MDYFDTSSKGSKKSKKIIFRIGISNVFLHFGGEVGKQREELMVQKYVTGKMVGKKREAI